MTIYLPTTASRMQMPLRSWGLARIWSCQYDFGYALLVLPKWTCLNQSQLTYSLQIMAKTHSLKTSIQFGYYTSSLFHQRLQVYITCYLWNIKGKRKNLQNQNFNHSLNVSVPCQNRRTSLTIIPCARILEFC